MSFSSPSPLPNFLPPPYPALEQQLFSLIC